MCGVGDKNLRVSAAIPCYNGEGHIAEAIRCLLRQTRRPDEIIVVDDGSRDRTAEIVRQFGDQVRLVQQSTNLGLAHGRNTIIENAAGDIIVFLDADAFADPGCVEAFLAEYTGEDVGGVGGNGLEVNINSIYDRWRQLHASQGQGEQRIENTLYLSGICCSYRRSALLKVGGFNTFFRTNGEDFDIGLRMARAGYRLVYTPNAVARHQRSDNWLSLHKMMYRYVYWALVPLALSRGKPPAVHFAHFITGEFVRWLWHDLSVERNLALAALNLTLFPIRLLALARAVLATRSDWFGELKGTDMYKLSAVSR